MAAKQSSSGFTLIEAVIAVAILGILAAGVAMFIRGPIAAYFDTANRAELTEAADGAIRRMSRDIQAALPNSLRAPTDGSTACVEFIPVVASGRYRIERDGTNDTNDDVLSFNSADTTFDVLADIGLNSLVGTNHVVIYNLGVAGASAYDSPVTNRSQIVGNPVTAPGGAKFRLTISSFQFPFASPSNRFQVIPNNSTVYSCAGGAIWQNTTRALNAGQLATCPGAVGNMLVNNIDCTQSFFRFVPATTQRDGMVEINLTLTRNNESIRLYDRVTVNNAP